MAQDFAGLTIKRFRHANLISVWHSSVGSSNRGDSMAGKEVNADNDILKPQNFLKAALNNDENALGHFRDEFFKLPEADKVRFIEETHRQANYIGPDTLPDTRVDDPDKKRVVRLRPTFDGDGNLADLDVATYTTNSGARGDGRFRELKEDLKIHDVFDSGTKAGAEIDKAQELEAKVAPFTRAYFAMRDATSLTDEGFTGGSKLWRSIKKGSTNGYHTDKYTYSPLSDKEEQTYYKNFLKTVNESLPPGSFDEKMIAEFHRQARQKNATGGIAGYPASDAYGLNTGFKSHTGDIYDANFMSRLPEKLEKKYKESIALTDDFWRKAKI